MQEQARETRIAAARAQLRQALGEMVKAERGLHGADSTENAEAPAAEAEAGRGTAGGQTAPAGQ